MTKRQRMVDIKLKIEQHERHLNGSELKCFVRIESSFSTSGTHYVTLLVTNLVLCHDRITEWWYWQTEILFVFFFLWSLYFPSFFDSRRLITPFDIFKLSYRIHLYRVYLDVYENRNFIGDRHFNRWKSNNTTIEAIIIFIKCYIYLFLFSRFEHIVQWDFSGKREIKQEVVVAVWFVVYCLTPPSTIFQLYRGSRFYWWRKLEYVIGTDCTGSCKSNYHTMTTNECPLIVWYLDI
jgi:hypothetical protein